MTPQNKNVSREKGNFYTYLWLRYDGTPYYVGKSRWRSQSVERAYRNRNLPRERVIVEDHYSEEAAFAAEIFLISFYGRKDNGTGILRNRTDGGEGGSGHIKSAEARKKISESKKGVPRSLESRRRMSEAKKGKPILHYDPQKHSEFMMGEGNPMFGKKREIDEQWRENLSKGKIGRVQSEDTRKKMSDAHRARKQCGRGYRPTHCYRGHEFTPDNTWTGKTGSRFCLQCRHINHETANERKREKRISSL